MRSRVLFLLAILMGIITTAIFFYMTQMDNETEVKEDAIPMVEVVVTNKQIGANQLLSTEDVIMKEIPETQLHHAMIQSIGQVEGKFTTDFMEEGEVVLNHRLKSSLEEDTLVSRKVEEGMLGVSVGVDIVRSVSNLIEPEDYVDIIFTWEAEDEDTGEDVYFSDVLLENIRVLAVGRKLVLNPNGGDYVEYSSLTLELNQEETVLLVNASENGSLHFAVRSRISQEVETDLEDTE